MSALAMAKILMISVSGYLEKDAACRNKLGMMFVPGMKMGWRVGRGLRSGVVKSVSFDTIARSSVAMIRRRHRASRTMIV